MTTVWIGSKTHVTNCLLIYMIILTGKTSFIYFQRSSAITKMLPKTPNIVFGSHLIWSCSEIINGADIPAILDAIEPVPVAIPLKTKNAYKETKWKWSIYLFNFKTCWQIYGNYLFMVFSMWKISNATQCPFCLPCCGWVQFWSIIVDNSKWTSYAKLADKCKHHPKSNQCWKERAFFMT